MRSHQGLCDWAKGASLGLKPSLPGKSVSYAPRLSVPLYHCILKRLIWPFSSSCISRVPHHQAPFLQLYHCFLESHISWRHTVF